MPEPSVLLFVVLGVFVISLGIDLLFGAFRRLNLI